MLSTIILACILAAITPFISFYASKWIEDGKRQRCFARLQAEPLLHRALTQGLPLSLYTQNHSKCIVDKGLLTAMEPGRMEFAWNGPGGEKLLTSFTGQEIESLIWVVEDMG